MTYHALPDMINVSFVKMYAKQNCTYRSNKLIDSRNLSSASNKLIDSRNLSSASNTSKRTFVNIVDPDDMP